MLLQSTGNYSSRVLRLFPVWRGAGGGPASFHGLRAKGAFVVSASYDNASDTVGNVSITSDAGRRCAVLSPWGRAHVAVASEGGEAVAVSWRSGDRPVFEFDTAAGATYTVSAQPSTPSRPKTDDETDSAARPQEMLEEATSSSLRFSGYDWTVKDSGAGKAGPGPNLFAASNAVVDPQGRLHMSIKGTQKGFTCAEIFLPTALGFGRYRWVLDTALDTMGPSGLAPHVVLGMFRESPHLVDTRACLRHSILSRVSRPLTSCDDHQAF